jgi:hypothetical protein
VLEVGNLMAVDGAFFDRAVLLADPGFNALVPAEDRSENAIVMTPEPGAAPLFSGVLLGALHLARRRRR